MKKTEKRMPLQSSHLTDTVAPLSAWYLENRRSLPWRDEPTPYHVWLSEVMLQQTRIAAVIPYYHRFLAALPTVTALSKVEDEALMKLWEGLGYYSRARNLKAAAKRIVEEFGGELPADHKALLSLPGIGEYTAGAIASIAFGLPEPAVDGNVLRVIMRLCDCHADITLPETKKQVTEALREIYPRGEGAGILTQAIMELGENVCIPNGQPRCIDCPLSPYCAALAANTVDELPKKTPKKPRRIEQKTVLLMEYEGAYALRQRPEEGLLAGLWEFPSAEGTLAPEAVAALLRTWGGEATSCEPIGHAVHVFTHVEWHMTGYRVICKTPPCGVTLATPHQLTRQYAIPRAFSYFVKLCLETE